MKHFGYSYVDLGLPSGLKWATCNVGANTPEETGLYFQWGDTKGYTNKQVYFQKMFSLLLTDYKFFADNKLTKYTENDGLVTLEASDDAATVNMGGNWRLPTKTEIIELLQNTDVVLVAEDGTEINGTLVDDNQIIWSDSSYVNNKGVKFYKKGNHSVYMFIPSCGFISYGSFHGIGENCCLLTASLNEEYTKCAYGITSDCGCIALNKKSLRSFGKTVRGVFK